MVKGCNWRSSAMNPSSGTSLSSLDDPRLARRRSAAAPPLTALAGLLCGLLAGCVEVPVDSLNGSPDFGRNPKSDMGTDMVQSSGPAWRWESPQPQGNNLRALWGIAGATVDQDQVYAGGDSGALLIGGSAGWQLQRSGIVEQRAVLAISGQSSGPSQQVLAVGFFDLALRRAQGQWSDISPVLGTGDGALTAAWASATAGEYFVVGTTGRIFHVTGTGGSWMREGMGVTPDSLFGIAGFGSGTSMEAYAVGANGRVLHRLGGTWMVEADNLVSSQLNSVWIGDGATSGEVFAVGDSGIVLHKQAGAWTVERAPATAQLTAVWGSGGDLYAVGAGGTILHRKGGNWQTEAAGLTSELLTALWGTVRGGQITLYAAGNLGTLLRLDAGQWQALTSRVTAASLSGVWARNPGEVYAIGGGGLIMRRSGTAAQGTWSTVGSGVTSASLTAIAGWSASPTAGEAEVYAVGASGTIVHKAGTTWTIDGGFLTTQDLTGVWAGQDSVYVIGRGGRIYHKLKGTWSIELGPMGVPVNNDLFGVWGTGTGSGEVVYISGDQGLLLRHDMLGWTQEAATLTTESLVALYGTNEDNLFTFGNKGGVFQRLAGKWQQVTNSPYGKGSNGIAGCVIPGTQELLTMGDRGIIARKLTTGWPLEALLTMQPYGGISAAARNDYYIVGSNGLILHKY